MCFRNGSFYILQLALSLICWDTLNPCFHRCLQSQHLLHSTFAQLADATNVIGRQTISLIYTQCKHVIVKHSLLFTAITSQPIYLAIAFSLRTLGPCVNNYLLIHLSPHLGLPHQGMTLGDKVGCLGDVRLALVYPTRGPFHGSSSCPRCRYTSEWYLLIG